MLVATQSTATDPAVAALPLPALAIQSLHTPGEGWLEAADWTATLEALHRGADGAAAEWRMALADRSLAGLPAALAAWGAERVAIGALVHLPLPGSADGDVLLLAPDRAAYARLCRLLSRMAEQPERIAAWLGDGLAAPRADRGPALGGLLALVRDATLGAALAALGAEVWWRCQREPDGADSGLPRALLPLVGFFGGAERAGQPIRQAVTRRAGGGKRRAPPRTLRGDTLALDELPALQAAFADAPAALLAGHGLLARCSWRPGGTWHLPPSPYEDDDEKGADHELERRVRTGVAWRYGDTPEQAVAERVTKELTVITGKRFSSYILTVADLAAGRRTCGRGSAASSIVCYCLGITNVDPIRWNLLFERFLNASRSDPPDIDVDFPWDERDAVFSRALATFGREHVAMVATHNRLKPAGALRAAARAWGVDDPDTSIAAARLADERRYGIPAGLPEPWSAIIDDAAQLVGLHLHDGLHCGGLVITREPLRDLVPVHPAAKELDDAERRWAEPAREPVPAIAWEKDGAEQLGLVKIDLLGNRSLAVVRDCLGDLAEAGTVIDEVGWHPEKDEDTQALVAAGDTMGCFYIESPAMRALQAKVGDGNFDRLVLHSSIVRPAAMGQITTYITRYHQVRRTGTVDEAWYPHQSLRDLLSESYGVISYQEDVMIIAEKFAGYDERGANALRKAMGFFGVEHNLLSHRAAFIKSAEDAGREPTAVREVWEMIASFKGYSFAKAHSASYAMVSFQCAWLKCHHPAVFLARVVANEGGFYDPSAYLEEARRRGIAIRGPCVAASAWKTAPEGSAAIRCGLHLVPQLSRTLAERIVEARAATPFGGIGECARRCAIPPRTLLALAEAGALDGLRPDLHRDQVRWVARVIALDGIRRAPEPPGTQWLFTPPEWADPPVPPLPRRPAEVVARERAAVLGLCPEHHPLAFHRRPDALRARDLAALDHGARVVIAGRQITRKDVAANTREGARRMAFVTFDDETGLIETVWFPAVYRRHGPLLGHHRALRLHGMVQVDFGVRTVQVDAAEPLEDRP